MQTDAWHELFVASAGAAAALAGLIIVAMSVNIREIIAIPAMPSRAGSSIAALVLIVVVSVAGLIPVQPSWMLGLETLAFSLVALAFAIDSVVRLVRDGRNPPSAGRARGIGNLLANGSISIVQIVPFVVGGLILLLGVGVDPAAVADGGLAWIAAGILLVFIGAVVNAWVLLVEILR